MNNTSFPLDSISSDEDLPLTVLKSKILSKNKNPNSSIHLPSRLTSNSSFSSNNKLNGNNSPNTRNLINKSPIDSTALSGSLRGTSKEYNKKDSKSNNISSLSINNDIFMDSHPRPLQKSDLNFQNKNHSHPKIDLNEVFSKRSNNPFIKKNNLSNSIIHSDDSVNISYSNNSVYPFLLKDDSESGSNIPFVDSSNPRHIQNSNFSDCHSEDSFYQNQNYNSEFRILHENRSFSALSNLEVKNNNASSIDFNYSNQSQDIKQTPNSTSKTSINPFSDEESQNSYQDQYNGIPRKNNISLNQQTSSKSSESYVCDFINHSGNLSNFISSENSLHLNKSGNFSIPAINDSSTQRNQLSKNNSIRSIKNFSSKNLNPNSSLSTSNYYSTISRKNSTFKTKSSSQSPSIRSLNKPDDLIVKNDTLDLKSENYSMPPSNNNSISDIRANSLSDNINSFHDIKNLSPPINKSITQNLNTSTSLSILDLSKNCYTDLDSNKHDHISPGLNSNSNISLSLPQVPVLFNNHNSHVSSSNFCTRKLCIDDYCDLECLINDLESYLNGVTGIEKRINSNLIKSKISLLNNNTKMPIGTSSNHITIKESNSKTKTNSSSSSYKSLTEKADKLLKNIDFQVISFYLFFNDTSIYYPIVAANFSSLGSILSEIKSNSIIDSSFDDWSFFNYIPHFKIDRPVNLWENLIDMFCESEKNSNFLIIKRYSKFNELLASSSLNNTVSDFSGKLFYRKNNSKWDRTTFCIKNLKLELAIQPKYKKNIISYSLDCYDLYLPTLSTKFYCTKFAFGLKPLMSSVLFEKPEVDYIKWFCAESEDDLNLWVKSLRSVINSIKFKSTFQKKAQLNKVKDYEDLKSFIPDKPLVNIGSNLIGKMGNLTINETSTLDNSNISTNTSLKIKPSPVNLYNIDTNKIIKLIEEKGTDYQTVEISELQNFGVSNSDPSVDESSSNSSNPSKNQKKNLNFNPGSLLDKFNNSKEKKTILSEKTAIDIFKKGSLLSDPKPNSSNAYKKIPASDSLNFTKGSLLQGLHKKTNVIKHNSFFGKPLVEIDQSHDLGSLNLNSSIEMDKDKPRQNYSIGVKPILSKPLITIINEPEFEFSSRLRSK
ncbi:hypothetical protein AYI70_g7631 [Smittium culicis]|uniref:PH domain-containing protein n=1 Tax=Smittium culicis TaxID=133412 RepID=A0A1R1XJQ5_9FUNG|nr:hypothetical protein AYI70_g7631 [Smittium culicis]